MVAAAPPAPGASPGAAKTASADPPASESSKASVRLRVLLPLAGLLTALGGISLLEIGPGYRGPGIEVVSVPAGVLVALGIALAVDAIWRPRRRGGGRRAWTPRAAPAIVVLAGVVFVAALLLSIGSLPGLYLRDHGSVAVPLTGCAGGKAYAPSGIPDAFPPGARVDIGWATENGRYAEFELQQESVNSLSAEPMTLERGTSGNLHFTGAGGPVAILAISNGTPYACAAPAEMLVSWAYATAA